MRAEIRMVRIVEAIGRYRSGELSCLEAGEVLGMSERHFRRLRDRYDAEGAEGIIDRPQGRPSGRRLPVDTATSVLELFDTRHWDFTAKHFWEKLRCEHGSTFSYDWVRLTLQA